MAYNEILAERVRKKLARENLLVEEKKMMGGLTFMVSGKMCVGISNDDLMARIAPEEYEIALQKKGCREMDLTGKPMRGFVFISAEGAGTDEGLDYWINAALAFNSSAKASKKTTSKSP